MTKRYGRNQRRKHREQIAEMEKHVARVEAQNLTLRHNQGRAVEEAFDMLMRDTGRIDAITERLTVELARKFGDELMPVVKQIVDSGRHVQRRMPIAFDARVPYDQTSDVLHIRGVIPELNYNYTLMRF